MAVTFPEASVRGTGHSGQLQTGAVLAAPKRKSLSCKAPFKQAHKSVCTYNNLLAPVNVSYFRVAAFSEGKSTGFANPEMPCYS